jgi:hypothetical protein
LIVLPSSWASHSSPVQYNILFLNSVGAPHTGHFLGGIIGKVSLVILDSPFTTLGITSLALTTNTFSLILIFRAFIILMLCRVALLIVDPKILIGSISPTGATIWLLLTLGFLS